MLRVVDDWDYEVGARTPTGPNNEEVYITYKMHVCIRCGVFVDPDKRDIHREKC